MHLLIPNVWLLTFSFFCLHHLQVGAGPGRYYAINVPLSVSDVVMLHLALLLQTILFLYRCIMQHLRPA
jgi:hypothetical protein